LVYIKFSKPKCTVKHLHKVTALGCIIDQPGRYTSQAPTEYNSKALPTELTMTVDFTLS